MPLFDKIRQLNSCGFSLKINGTSILDIPAWVHKLGRNCSGFLVCVESFIVLLTSLSYLHKIWDELDRFSPVNFLLLTAGTLQKLCFLLFVWKEYEWSFMARLLEFPLYSRNLIFHFPSPNSRVGDSILAVIYTHTHLCISYIRCTKVDDVRNV